MWVDGTLRRDGWRCQHVSISGSLRALQIFESEFAQTAFIARQDLPAYEPADLDTRRVIDMWTKVLARGSAPPIHPTIEHELLRREGFGEGDFKAPAYPGDLAPRIVKPHRLELFVPVGESVVFDPLGDSDAENDFLTWISKSHPELVPFVTPQASFDLLVAAHGGEKKGARRIDFTVCLPSGEITAVEIDGAQHDGQGLTDAQRDATLSAIGVETIRIPIPELETGSGPNLAKVSELATKTGRSGQSQPIDALSWTPVLLHRLAYAVGEACASGFLAGDKWVISLNEPTRHLAEIFGPYLDMLRALDNLWGAGAVAPETVVVTAADHATRYQISETGSYEKAESELLLADVHIDLDVSQPPAAELRPHPDVPTIICRTAAIGVTVLRPPAGGSQRISARTGERDTQRALTSLLQGIFAKEAFRSGQYQAVAELIAGRDCCVLLPTGAGKSLIYQLAGLCMPGRTLIIDPIVSLIEDQVRGLDSHGINRAIGITSQTTQMGHTDDLLRAVADADAYFVFVAPERLQTSKFRLALRELATSTPINLAVIDEAHCVSEWGHQFRTSYLGLGRVIRDVAKDTAGTSPPLVALTGTASRAVLRDVLFQLEIREDNANTIVRPDSFDRKELNYRIIRCEPDMAEVSLRSALKTLPADFNEQAPMFYSPDGERTFSGLIFVPTVNGKTNGLRKARAIAEDVIPAVGVYSGSAPKGIHPQVWEKEKRYYAEEFKQNTLTCLVSTKAFGMGIDKPNIRWVIHYGLSGSIESYYQEVGRAGRNGARAECILILSEYDQIRNSRMLAEDVTLEEASSQLAGLKWAERDDVTTAMFFHVNSFPGIDDELAALKAVVQQISPTGQKKQEELPFDGDEGRQERALHRLVLLGVIEDYLVEFGAKKFDVTVRGSTAELPKQKLKAFVQRTQPGRAEEMSTRVNAISESHHDTILRCGRLLIEFVYETVERSRRRSLREMLLAARNSTTDDELRRRVLEYLSEGDVGNILEVLVDETEVNLSRWREEWVRIVSRSDAAEWRASTARLLASYPDHPGLLLSRGLSELLDTADDTVDAAAIDEYALNLEAALQSATPLYKVPAEQVCDTVQWLATMTRTKEPSAFAATISVAERYDVLTSELLADLMSAATHDLHTAAVYLDHALIEAFHLTDSITTGAPQ